MVFLIFGLILFFGIHSAQIAVPDIRARTIEKGGSLGAWMWPYTGIAGTGLVLIIIGYGLARYQTPVLYYPPAPLRHLALVVMLPVFPLLFAAYIKGGIKQVSGHPMLIATILWACAHLMANGSLTDVLVFGSFLVWAVLDWRSLLRREGAAVQQDTVQWGRNDAIAIMGGLIVYVAFMAGFHAWLFGVSPV